MKKCILPFLLLCPLSMVAQTTIHIDATVTYQTNQGFGASDAWTFDPVGKHWSLAVKNSISQKLFAKTSDSNGNPLGIGLSRWRFNIGAGSAEQGDTTIDKIERRAECFLNQDGTGSIRIGHSSVFNFQYPDELFTYLEAGELKRTLMVRG